MFGKEPRVNPLEARKRLLLAESELNRAGLAEDWQTLTGIVRGVVHRGETIVAWAPAAALLVAGLAALRRRKAEKPAAKSSWFEKLLSGARLASTVWLASRGRRQQARPAPRAGPEVRQGEGAGSSHFVAMLGLLSLVVSGASNLRLSAAPALPPLGQAGAHSPAEAAGPTLLLDYGHGESAGNPIAEFMYFVPLISLEPVSIVKSPGNTQRARMQSASRSFTASSFVVNCEFEFIGDGHQQNIFDHTDKVRSHARELKEGGTLDHQLGSINVEGAGSVSIQVVGTMNSNAPTVTEVRLRFNGRGQPSPVTIGLHDIQYFEGSLQQRNERIARVNTLIFRRRPGPSKMDITVASVKRKDAGDGFLQGLFGGLKGAAVNLFIQPIAVERAGSEAMLNFGLALALEAPAYTFPRAKNLKAGG